VYTVYKEVEMVESLASARYVSLTTFKKDGTTASTPVWIASDDGERLLVYSPSSTWKVRRVRRDPRVLVAPCTFRGRERSERLPGKARIVEGVATEALLRAKYGWQKRALDFLNRRSAGEGAWVTIEIVDP
jgi:uncharacterized protein